ncbi:MAG: response regulator [Clostridia bacterium]
MKKNNIASKKQQNNSLKIKEELTEILKHCGIHYWMFYPASNTGVSGLNAMPELGISESWENFPQYLVDMGLIHEDSIEEWMYIHEQIKQGEAHIYSEIQVIEQGVPIWKRIQYITTFDESGRPVSAIGIAENISTYKRLAETYMQAAKQSGMTCWILDIESKTIYNFNNTTNINAYDNVTMIKNVPESIISDGSLHPDDVPALVEMYNKIFAGEKTAKSVGRWKNTDSNTWCWNETTYNTIFDNSGKAVKAIGSVMDITERVSLEERYSEEIEWRKVHNQDVLGSFKMNLTKNTCGDGQGNNSIILGFKGNGTVDGFFESEYATHVEADDLAEYKKIFNRKNLLKSYQAGKTNFTHEAYVSFAADDFRWIKIELDMFKNPKNSDIEGYIYATDIDNKKMEHALVDTVVNMDYDYLALLDIVTDRYTIYAKTDGKTPLPSFGASNYEKEVAQFAHEYLLDEDIEQNIHDMSYKNILEQLEKQDVYTSYCRVKAKNGTIARKKLQFSYLDKPRKKIILTRTDITDIYNGEQRKNEALKDALLAAQQANNTKSEFLSRMSHEIRTPMNAIIGMATLAAQCVNDPAQVSDYLSKVGISARFLLSLINDILDMSRIESGKVLIRSEKIPFEEFINGVNSICHAQAQQKGVEYDAIMTSFIEDYYIGDAMKLQQVLINIISNAIKFTPQGGKVQLIVHQEIVKQDKALMKFTINDTGIGIREDFMPNLFEPFEQANSGASSPYGGTGLGLAICKNLVDLMGGKISANSIEGIGSEFVVEVKLGITEESKQALEFKSDIYFDMLKALIVDDDIMICQHTAQVLLDMGMRAEYVISGAKAVEIIRSKQEKKEFYDVVLLDWKMPDMDGIETAREIRKIVGPEVTIIIMTAYDWAAIEAEAKQAGVNMLISKPLFKSSLCSAFEKIYTKKGVNAKPVVSQAYDFTGKRVLLVEDHVLNIEVAKKLLNAKNIEVEIAENGLLAIETFAQKEDGYYDAILMDILMPVMDGITAAKAIRHMRKADAITIPIIAMTANAFDEDVEKTRAAGMNAHLVKPIEPALLYQTMQSFFQKGGTDK